jgi:dipeptidase D
MSNALQGLEPHLLWKMFGCVSGYPRGSKHEAALAAALAGFAREKGLHVLRDSIGNVCVRVPATAGCETAPCVVVQAHLDMVCEKDPGLDFDFEREPVCVVRDGDWVTADGTTLGADNGIGVAAALALACDPEGVHGPLEILLTVDEETGLTGARNLDPDMLCGRIMLNLDSQSTGSVCIGCAGGGAVDSRLPLTFCDSGPDAAAFTVSLNGLQGGHSGLDIHENRGNAIRLLALWLQHIEPLGARLVSFQGGDKHNAIPRSAAAHFCLPAAAVNAMHSAARASLNALRACYPHEEQLRVQIVSAGVPEQVLTDAAHSAALRMLIGFPNGVVSLSRTLEGLVETSNNLATAAFAGGALVVHNSPRSSNSHALDAVVQQIVSVAGLAGASSTVAGPYPGWQPDTASLVLGVVEEAHAALFGFRPVRRAVHAGLECGIIGNLYPGMDMVSIGPDIINCHSPSEAVNIESVGRFWMLLTEVLKRIAGMGR